MVEEARRAIPNVIPIVRRGDKFIVQSRRVSSCEIPRVKVIPRASSIPMHARDGYSLLHCSAVGLCRGCVHPRMIPPE